MSKKNDKNFMQTYVNKRSTDANGVVNSEKAGKMKKRILIISGFLSLVFLVVFAYSFFISRYGAANWVSLIILILSAVCLAISLNVFRLSFGIVVVVATAKWLDNSPRCPKCGDIVEEGEVYCNKCGYRVDMLGKKVCGECGAENKEENIFCSKCGNRL